MVTGKSQPGIEPVQLPPTSPNPVASNSPPSRRDLASWWRQFKRNTRKEELKATDVEGIFRLNGSAKRIKDLQEVFDSPERYGKGLDWSGYTVHDAANVLRRYLNQLPEPIVPLEFYERFREPLRIYQRQVQAGVEPAEAEKFDHAKAVETYQQLIIALPPLNKQLLLYILDLLAVFASKSDQNRMTSANLSAIFQPGMLSHPQHDMSPEEYKLSQDVLIFLIENQDHFLVGMSGTGADEQQVKEVEAGIQPRPTTTGSNIRRSASNASNSNESNRKLDTLRRNVSVSSRNSRTSNTAPSPGTPTSGGGVHRSNTLPSKMGPVLTSARFTRANENNTSTPSGLSVSHQSSRSASRAPSLQEEMEQKAEPKEEPKPEPTTEQRNPGLTTTSSKGTTLVHTSTHGPVPIATAERLSITNPSQLQEISQTPASPPFQAVTPTRERKLSNIFSKSPPPDGDQREPRQPKRLQKRRIPGSASLSAQSSSNSLHGTPSDLNIAEIALDTKREPPSMDLAAHPSESNPALVEGSIQHATEGTLRPHQSRTPSMNSRSSFTDASDLEQNDDGSHSERRDHRRSWRFHRSAKRSSEQVGLGLASPPLAATNPAAEHSTTSFGSGHQPSNDPSSQPLSLDAGISSSGTSGTEPERKSLFGKFKAKVAQVVKDDRERAKSPTQDIEPSPSQPLSPPASDAASKPSVEIPTEHAKEEPVRSPVSPLPGAGLPPPIPEEPHSPEAATAVPSSEHKEPLSSNSQSLSTETPTDGSSVPKAEGQAEVQKEPTV
ncbi:hypothetical protein N7533_002119 [Penicillium manginii]|uniref:uncharacterized protein n=1 Tax=Penicillium manginii TaxID=203109 RepID=UPI0025485374|nr:uncharacterized protein N7533_002119 [Penicillium manginii]KAJ5763438.1 hypothetical protein N7533_002119 [Penicillium manginii]